MVWIVPRSAIHFEGHLSAIFGLIFFTYKTWKYKRNQEMAAAAGVKTENGESLVFFSVSSTHVYQNQDR